MKAEAPGDGRQPESEGAGGAIHVQLHGELDMATVDDAHSVLGRALVTRPATLIVDLSDLTFVDCSGLAVLVEARSFAARWGGSVTVVRPPAQVLHLLQLTQLAVLFGLPAGTGDSDTAGISR